MAEQRSGKERKRKRKRERKEGRKEAALGQQAQGWQRRSKGYLGCKGLAHGVVRLS